MWLPSKWHPKGTIAREAEQFNITRTGGAFNCLATGSGPMWLLRSGSHRGGRLKMSGQNSMLNWNGDYILVYGTHLQKTNYYDKRCLAARRERFWRSTAKDDILTTFYIIKVYSTAVSSRLMCLYLQALCCKVWTSILLRINVKMCSRLVASDIVWSMFQQRAKVGYSTPSLSPLMSRPAQSQSISSGM